jgi:hypothetical protein
MIKKRHKKIKKKRAKKSRLHRTNKKRQIDLLKVRSQTELKE